MEVVGVLPLDWHIVDYQWTNPFTGNNFNFFQYSVQLGRHVLSDSWDVLPTAIQYWSQWGITPKFLAKFKVNLWARKQSRKILHVQWLLVHRALLVGTWLHKISVSSSCPCVIFKLKLRNIVYRIGMATPPTNIC